MTAVSAQAAIAMPQSVDPRVSLVAPPRLHAANDCAPQRRQADGITLPARLTGACGKISISRDGVRLAENAAATEPLSSYRGVAVTVAQKEGKPLFSLTLAHEDGHNTVPLGESADASVIARQWQAWAKALSLPLIAIDPEGTVHAEMTAIGVVMAERPLPRRSGSPLVGRRSRYGRRRRNALPSPSAGVKVAATEIIART
ncbi:MAG: DUF6101 family protein [Pseudomonadota bacterium]